MELPSRISTSSNKSAGYVISPSSADQSMNASEGIVSFSADKLTLTSISKGGSIFNLWVQEPSFSNSAGTANYAGVVFNPGFIGSGGKLLTLNFKAKAEGNATLSFTSASVLANNGYGTNIFSDSGTANFNITPAPPKLEPKPKPEPVKTIENTPLAPQVTSPTHPDSSKWYNNNNPVFNWKLATGITGVNVLADRRPTTNPGVRSDGLEESWDFKNVKDGEWYFHIRLRNSAGWGGITHFKFNVDTVAPETLTAVFKETEATDPKPTLKLSAYDRDSGIDHYEIIIDGEEPYTWQDDGTGEHQLPLLAPGTYEVVIKAVDKAGNYKEIKLSRKIKALEPPIITEYPEILSYGDPVLVKGTSEYPKANIIISVERNRKIVIEDSVVADSFGNFTFGYMKKLKEGAYSLTAKVIDERGAQSLPSDEITFLVYATWADKLLLNLVDNVAVLLITLLLLIIIISNFLYFWLYMKKAERKKKVWKEKRRMICPYTSQPKLKELYKDLEKHIKSLEKIREKRSLSFKESRLIIHHKNLMKVLAKYMKKSGKKPKAKTTKRRNKK
ncbi:cohesin domain-containing protein [Patescibacteria group bacterium]